jgi:GMP synthase (glutamine-hydrolysing)
MNVLIFMHVESEGPGTLGTFLESVGATTHLVRLYAGEPVPDAPDGFDAVVSMGGPMNVYEEDTYPFLKEETDFLRKTINADVPALGICLGSQMIAKAAGAHVDLSVTNEIGWGKIHITKTGHEDVLFRGVPETLDVLQWHSDMFHVPEGGSLLARSEACPHQAFRYRNAYGLQFHVEVTPEILSDWFAGNQEADLDEILKRYSEIRTSLVDHAETLYRAFWSVIRK